MTSRSRVRLIAWVCAVACTLVAPEAARAFSVDNHDQITAAAMTVLRTCSDPNAKAIANHVETLQACDRVQDAWTRKLILWHFYSPKQEPQGTILKGKWFNVASRLDDYYRSVVEHLHGSIGTSGAVGDVGALLHYVQDVCVPAHVVPIFHPSPVWSGDAFDGYADDDRNDGERACRLRRADLPKCDDIIPNTDETWASLLARTARSTSNAIEEPKEKEQIGQRPWRRLWNTEIDPKSGFGSYGCAGNHFGDVDAHCDGRPLELTDAKYCDFATARYRAAVEATVRALLLADKEGVFANTAQGAATCPVASRDHGTLVIERIATTAAGAPSPALVVTPVAVGLAVPALFYARRRRRRRR